MFCKNCGAEINDTAKFCPKCGNNISGEEKKNIETKNDNTVKFQLKPKFNWGYKLVCTLGTAVLWAVIILFFAIGSIEDIEILLELLSMAPIMPMAIVIGVVLLYTIIKLIIEKMQYDDLEYNFYNTKVEYKDGFLNKEEKELKYKYIREVTMNQNILERIFHIGTIRIFTNASSGMVYGNSKHNKMYGKNGLAVHCVENVGEQYKKVKELIDEGTPED